MEIDSLSPIEVLESRIAPAVVTVDFSAGVLSLTGGNDGHSFTIVAIDTSTFELQGAPGTTFQLGSDPAESTLRLTGPIKSLGASFGSGDDHIQISGIAVKGEALLGLGDGANSITINSISTKGRLILAGGNGTNDIMFESGNIVVKEHLEFNFSDGTNNVVVNSPSFQIGLNVIYRGGDNFDSIAFGPGKATIGGHLKLNLDRGDGVVNFSGSSLTVGRDIFISSAETLTGSTSVEFGSGVYKIVDDLTVVGGAANDTFVTTSDTALLIGSLLGITTGPGEYNIELEGQVSAKLLQIDASNASGGEFSYTGIGSKTIPSISFTGSAGSDDFDIELEGATVSTIIADLREGANDVEFDARFSKINTVTIQGGAGTDNFDGNLAHSTVTGSFTIDNGDGRASTRLQTANAQVKGLLTISGGAGSSTDTHLLASTGSRFGGVSLSSATDTQLVEVFTSADLTIKGALGIVTGDGEDSVQFHFGGPGTIGEGISIDLGDGVNEIIADLAGIVTSSLTIDGGSDDDDISFQGIANLGKVNLALGDGDNFAGFTGNSGDLVMRSFTLTSLSSSTDADAFTLARVQVLGKFVAQFGDGFTNIFIDDSTISGHFTLTTGADTDFVRLDTKDTLLPLVFAKSVTIELGDDNDLLVLGGNDTTNLLIAKSSFKADGGAGTDTLTNAPTNIFAKEPEFTGFE